MFVFSEADAEIASLANAWNCHVLSSDSDFFIYNIKAGYIPFIKTGKESFSWESIPLTAQIFHRSELATHLGIKAKKLPLFASLVGNDYVSFKVLEPLYKALGITEETRFERIASILSSESVWSVHKKVSRYGGDQLKQAVRHSLQEYKIKESDSNLLPYFENRVVCSSLTTQNDREIPEWLLRRFREGQFSTNCMSGLTAGKVFLKAQVEDCQEVSANRCSETLRRFVYGILSNAVADDEEGNITMVREWDRNKRNRGETVHVTVRPSNVPPYQEGAVRGVSPILRLLNALDSNTDYIKSLPEKFQLIAASLRFLVKNSITKIEMNHLTALLCSCVILKDGSEKQDMESPFSQPEEQDSVEQSEDAVIRKPSGSKPFDLRAAHSFSQWQCVLRDAIDLNFILLEPVETPCIHKTFNGKLAHRLRGELHQGMDLHQHFKYFKLISYIIRNLYAMLNSLYSRFLFWGRGLNARLGSQEHTRCLSLCQPKPYVFKFYTRGRDSHMEAEGMLVVSLLEVNFGFLVSRRVFRAKRQYF